MRKDLLEEINSLNIPRTELWKAEAEFGFKYVSQYCENIRTRGDVLEIGCGSGLLLSMLAQQFAKLDFVGIEPISGGFSSLVELNRIVKESGVQIENVGFADFVSSKKYKLIFSVNVFEHVDDWREFLTVVSELLDDNGTLLILCPNYGFPYEPHFRIPIIINKKITFTLFENYIYEYEKKKDIEGLWNSLNLVKKKEVLNFLENNKSKLKLNVFDDISIIDEMIERVTIDKEFRKRQWLIGTVAVLLKKFGVIKAVRIFPRYFPYMKLVLKKS